MAVQMEDSRLVLMGAGCNEEVRYRYAMSAADGQVTLSCSRDCDRLGVCPQFVERVELVFEPLECSRGASAVQHLESRDCAEARLSELRIDFRRAHERGLVQKEPPLARGGTQRHARSESNRSTSTSDRTRLSAACVRLRRSSTSGRTASSPSALPPSSARRSSSTLRSEISGQRLWAASRRASSSPVSVNVYRGLVVGTL